MQVATEVHLPVPRKGLFAVN